MHLRQRPIQMLLPRRQPLHHRRIPQYKNQKGDPSMNLDNRRLKEIQQYKKAYQDLMDKSLSITDIFDYEEKLQELQEEEKEILARCDVKI